MIRFVTGLLAIAFVLTGPMKVIAQPDQAPELHQPSSIQTVIVPGPSNSAVNFDWSDVPGATSYRLEVTRQGTLPVSATSTRSEAVFSPLAIGTPGLPVQYTWQVVPIGQGGEGPASTVQSFGLSQGTVTSFSAVPGGLSSPANPRVDPHHSTLPLVNNEGLFMQWDSVEGAATYETQLLLEETLDGSSFNFLQYRMRVSQPMAFIGNLAFPGKYRFDVRAVESGGAVGNPASGSFHVVESFMDVTGDRVLDLNDLLSLAGQWKTNASAPPAGADIILDGEVGPSDLTAVLIRLKDSTLSLPSGQKASPEEATASAPAKDPSSSPQDRSSKSTSETGWLRKVGNMLFASPACAGTVPEAVDKGSDEEQGIPKILFPNCEQCIGPTTLEMVWTEIPEATSYQVEFVLRFNSGASQKLPISGEGVFDSQNGLLVDTDLGDGVVRARSNPTLSSVIYTVRVRAIFEDKEGPWTRKKVLRVSSNCPPRPTFPYIDLDFDGDRDFRGTDLLAFAGGWYSATQEHSQFDPRFDLSPFSDGNGFVGAPDLLQYRDMFRDRCFRPKSLPLDPPILNTPENGALFLNPQFDNFGLDFSWFAPLPNGPASASVYELEILFPGAGVPTRFYTSRTTVPITITVGGTYLWRVRAIADDTTLGQYSQVFSFTTETPSLEVDRPTLMGPPNNATFAAGDLVRFTWSREEGLLPKSCRFDRIEIYNGDIFSVSLDIYHKATEVSQPTVTVEVPLFPNFGSTFRWRIIPYQELTDDKPELFQLSGESTGFRNFRILRGAELDPEVTSGIGGTTPDFNKDGIFELADLGPLSRTWYSGRTTSPRYDINFDYDFDGQVEIEEFIRLLEVRLGKPALLNEPLAAPIPIGPRPDSEGIPDVITFSNPGIVTTWFPLDPGVEHFLVEWVDLKRHYHAHYAEKLELPDLVSPTSGETVIFNERTDTLHLVWEGIPDAQEYEIKIVNPNNGAARIWDVPAPSNPFAATVEFSLTANVLIPQVTPDADGTATYRIDISPQACAHYADFAPVHEVPVVFNFPIGATDKKAAELELKQASQNKLNLPLLITGSARIFAAEPGLYHWRVTPVAPNGKLGLPSRWSTFAVSRLPSPPFKDND